MLNFIPFARSWWKMTDSYFKTSIICKSLELFFHTPMKFCPVILFRIRFGGILSFTSLVAPWMFMRKGLEKSEKKSLTTPSIL
jgi:hypothetical protein